MSGAEPLLWPAALQPRDPRRRPERIPGLLGAQRGPIHIDANDPGNSVEVGVI
jgi:hypothetical protein